MIAVTVWSDRSTVTWRMAWTAPKYASNSRTAMRVAGVARFGALAAAAPSVRRAKAASGRDTRGEADDKDDADKDEGTRPGLRMPLVVGTDCIIEDL